MRLFSVSRIAIAACLSAWSAQALAADESDSSGTARKDDIVVTAKSRQELQDILSPGVVSVVYPDDTRGEQKSLPDLLDQVAGVYVRRVAGTGSFTTASIRGSAPSQVNIYIDGVPFNTASETAADLSTLPINNVERLEVYRGLTPARFSGAPIGGAINIVTKLPTSLSATASLGARSWGGRQATVSIEAPLFGGGLLIGADLEQSKGDFTYRNIAQNALNAITFGNAGYNGSTRPDTPQYTFSDPLDGGDGEFHVTKDSDLANRRRRLSNSYLKDNFLVKWRNDHLTLKYAFTHMDRDMPNPIGTGYTPVDDYVYANPAAVQEDQYRTGSGVNRRRNQLQKQHDAALGWQDTIGKAALSANLNLMDQDRSYRNLSDPYIVGIGNRWAHYHTTRFGGALNATYTLGEQGAVPQLLEFHAEHSYEKMNYDASGLISSVTGKQLTDYYTDFARHRTNFQLQDTVTIRPLGDLQITPVVRLEKLSGPVLGTNPNLLGQAPHTSGAYDWTWTYGASAKKKIGNDWLIFGSVGTYRRYPGFYEIYGDGLYVQAGTDSLGRVAPLLPEDGRTWDAGLGWNGTLLGDLSGSFRATYFHRKAINEITFFNAPLGARYLNSGTTIHEGGEFEGSLAWGSKADLQFALTLQDGYYRKGTYYLYPAVPAAERVTGKLRSPNSPPVVANARLNLHFLNGALTTFGEVKYKGRNVVDQYSAYETYETALTTVDLGAHLKIQPGFAFSLGVNDVFDAGPRQRLKGNHGNVITANYYRCDKAYAYETGDTSCYDNNENYVSETHYYDSNIYFPQQGRTFYFTVSKAFGPRDGESRGADTNRWNGRSEGGQDWSGFYIGGQIGRVHAPRTRGESLLFSQPGGGTDRRIEGALQADPNGSSYLADGVTRATTNAFHNGFDGSGAALGATRDAGIRRDRTRSVDYGVRAGYDRRLGSWVFGVVADWTRHDLIDSVSGYTRLEGLVRDDNGNSSAVAVDPTSYVLTRQLDWVAALRARAGYRWKGVLGYMTAGPALSRIRHSFSTTDIVNAFGASGTGSSRPGWQYGGGVEFRVRGPFTVGLEYLHTMLHDGAYAVTATTGASGLATGFQTGCNLPSGATCQTAIQRSRAQYDNDALRVTMGYRF